MSRVPTRAAAAAVATLALLGLSAAPTTAIPPGGADSDTPGTSSSVSPRTLAPGARIRFTVSGFPAGETVYIKIDDGQSCSAAATHGGCVYHEQKLSSRGSASGSFDLPRDLGAGRHWLRFLASEQMYDANGDFQGVKGYTRRGGADFTVVAASSSGAAGGSASGGAGTTGGGGGSTTEDDVAPAVPGASASAGQPSAAASAGAGGVVKIQPGSPTTSASSEPTAEPATDGSDATAAAATVEESGFPVVGASALAVLLLAAGVIAWLGLRRKASGQADG